MAHSNKGTRRPDWKQGYANRNLLYDSEGMTYYCQAACPFEQPEDRRRIGWNLGRQIVCQHLVELALKAELVKHGNAVPQHHNLEALFSALPARRQRLAERCYQQLLHSRVEWTWDVYIKRRRAFRMKPPRTLVNVGETAVAATGWSPSGD